MKDNNIIGFDIGEKNLSYCLINYDKKQLEIIKWDRLDISYNKMQCKEIVNKRAICNKSCKYYENTDNGIKGYCKMHATYVKKNDKEKFKKMCILSNNEELSESSTNKLKNLIIRLLKALHYIVNIIKKNNLINVEVYIENQLTDNQTMKNIAICIFMFFTNLKMISQYIKIVNFINANIKTSETILTTIINTNVKISKIINIDNIIYLFKKDNIIVDSHQFKINKNFDKLKQVKLYELIITNIINNNDKINYKELQNIMKDYDYRKLIVILMTNIMIKKLNNTNINNIINITKYYLSQKKDDMADSFIYCIIVLLKNSQEWIL